MGKKKNKRRGGTAPVLGSAAAAYAILSRPIVKELVVRAILAGAKAAARSPAVRDLAGRIGKRGR